MVSVSRCHLNFASAFMVIFIWGLFIIGRPAYFDVRPLEDVKSSIMSTFSAEEGQRYSTMDFIARRTEPRVAGIASRRQETADEMAKGVATTKHIRISGGVVVGADGHYITLRNNPYATNPSWEELRAFLLRDKTDSMHYDSETFVCADFAEMIHNNAEARGIRTAFVDIRMGSGARFPSGVDHALNAFETTDRGLVYIDCTSSNQQGNADKIVGVEVEKEYIPRSIFHRSGWEAMCEKVGITMWGSAGIVEEIRIIEW